MGTQGTCGFVHVCVKLLFTVLVVMHVVMLPSALTIFAALTYGALVLGQVGKLIMGSGEGAGLLAGLANPGLLLIQGEGRHYGAVSAIYTLYFGAFFFAFISHETLLLPAVTLGLPMAAILMRVTRASMLEVLRQDYITFAEAKGLSLKKTREDNTWEMKLTAPERIAVRMPNATNVSSCEMTVNYAVGQGQPLVDALTAWGANQPVPLQRDKAGDSYTVDNVKYATTNWVAYSATTRMGVAFTEQKKTDGSPAGKNADQATVSMSFRALSDQDRTASQ